MESRRPSVLPLSSGVGEVHGGIAAGISPLLRLLAQFNSSTTSPPLFLVSGVPDVCEDQDSPLHTLGFCISCGMSLVLALGIAARGL